VTGLRLRERESLDSVAAGGV